MALTATRSSNGPRTQPDLATVSFTHLRATDFDPAFAETVTGQGQAIDGLIGAGTATITVAAAGVPEPGGLVLALLGGLGRSAR